MRPTIVEIPEQNTAVAVPALQVLWPKYDAAEMGRIIDTMLRPNGYRLVGIVPKEGEPAACVMGFRLQHSLWLGKSLYIVDIATLPDWRGRGYASHMLDWAAKEAERLDCNALHLDSGVGPDRSDAHRLYMAKRYRIGCHHFVRKLG
ncbi:GNAT family N-acetyltransferase [Azospirillum thermophilum]|uniref:GCN5-related N-acetyltransferase n=1 Tax=Azospirillum thermophilum TaxID=2202148 RepID=A0A2S2CK94_9PROT|nr:GNAT family N-acetyltransferase [Azospirillum thermophilum]AWK84923.1 GCN5-related N-acetyltransferase [Azospirillum thermophilum]